MTNRSKVSTASRVAATGLLAGTSLVIATGSELVAGASAFSTCPTGSLPASEGLCEVLIGTVGTSSWTVPKGVTNIEILTVGAGGGGGAGSGYASGGGGGGGQAQICNATVADLTKLTVDVGAGGAGGTASMTSPTPGATGHQSDVKKGATPLCIALPGKGGAAGYFSTTSATSGASGGASGSSNAGGSGAGLVSKNPLDCPNYGTYYYNLGASGGGGALAAGQAPGGTGLSGAGGTGATPTSGYYFGNTSSFGGGGGGGGGANCSSTWTGGAGGTGGGGTGATGNAAATAGTAQSGGGGGGGGGLYSQNAPVIVRPKTSFVVNGSAGAGTNGAAGGSGFVEIRFLALAVPTPSANVYFGSGSSTLTAAGDASIKAFAKAITAGHENIVMIKAYTDPAGTAAQNKTLSQQRANAVEKYLKAQLGSSASNFTITATGEGATNKFGSPALDRVAQLTSVAPVA